MNREEIVKVVMSALEKHVEGLTMTEEMMSKTLVDLGVDSLNIMLVIMEVGETVGIVISDDEADALDTPEKIVDLLAA